MTGFTQALLLQAGFLIVAMFAGTLIPSRRPDFSTVSLEQPELTPMQEVG